MVRVYANLSGLSKALSKAKLVGPEKRSLAPFAASFTRSQDLFDFIDADDKKEGADFKIRGTLHIYMPTTGRMILIDVCFRNVSTICREQSVQAYLLRRMP
jgi:hypothetical protein